jgi:RHS repeat-associated protein
MKKILMLIIFAICFCTAYVVKAQSCTGYGLGGPSEVCPGSKHNYYLYPTFNSNIGTCTISSVSGGTRTAGTTEITWGTGYSGSVTFNCSCGEVTQPIAIKGPIIDWTVSSASTCTNANSITLTASGTNGTVQRWERKLTGEATWTSIAVTAKTLTTPDVSTTSSGQYRVFLKNNCGYEGYSSEGSVSLTPLNSYYVSGGGVYCGGTTTTIYLQNSTGQKVSQAGVTYTLSRDEGGYSSSQSGGGEVQWLNISLGGNYRVTATKNGDCSTQMGSSFPVTFKTLPVEYTVSPASRTICSGTSTNITLGDTEIGATYVLWKYGSNSWFPAGQSINGTGNAIDFTVSAAGTYRVEAELNDCYRLMSGTSVISVETAPTLTNWPTSAYSRLCGQAVNFTPTADLPVSNYTWSSIPTRVTGNTSTTGSKIDDHLVLTSGSSSGSAIYTVTAVGPSPRYCQSSAKTLTVNVSAMNTYLLQGGNAICAGQSVTLTMGNSQSPPQLNVSYTLKKEGVSGNYRPTVTGDGVNPISWTGINESGVYYVDASKDGSCNTRITTSSATVNVIDPTAFAVTPANATICDGNTVTISLGQSESNTIYYLKRKVSTGWTEVQRITRGTTETGAFSFTPVGVAGEYMVEAGLQGCMVEMSNRVNIIVNPIPSITNLPNTLSRLCGEQVAFTPTSTATLSSIVWTSTATGVTGNTSTSGSAINDRLYLSAAQTAGLATYSVKPKGIAPTFCEGTTNTLTVNVGVFKTYALEGGGSFCSGTPTTIKLKDSNGTYTSQNGVTYTLKRGTTTIGTVTGNNGTVQWTNITVAGTYFVEASSAGFCPTKISTNDAVVTTKPLPTQYVVSPGAVTICSGASATLSIPASQSAATYKLIKLPSTVADTKSGSSTGSGITFTTTLGAGTYKIEATLNGCVSDMQNQSVVSVASVPQLTNLPTTLSRLCGQSVNFTPTDNLAGTSYLWTSVASSVLGNSSSTGNKINDQLTLAPSALSGSVTYSVKAIGPSPTYCQSAPATLTVNLAALNTYVASPTGSSCAGASTSITLIQTSTGTATSQSGVTYWLKLDGTIVPNSNIDGGGLVQFTNITSPGEYRVVGLVNGVCETQMTSGATILPQPDPKPVEISHNGFYCGLPVTITLPSVEAGVTYDLYRGSSKIRSAAYDEDGIVWEGISAIGEYHVMGYRSGCSAVEMANRVTLRDGNGSAPSFVVSGELNVCDRGATVLTAEGSDINTFLWYDASNGLLGYGDSYTTPELENTTSFKAIGYNDVGCSREVVVTVNVRPEETLIPAQPVLITSNNQYQVDINNPNTAAHTFFWQSLPDGLSTATLPNPRSINPGYHYVRARNQYGCWGPATGIFVPDFTPTYTEPIDPENVNYVRTFKYQVKNFNGDPETAAATHVQMSTTYLDGIGRPFQQVNKANSYYVHDVVSIIDYDPFGRETVKYLPYASGASHGKLQLTGFSDQDAFYDNADKVAHSNYPFAYSEFEQSPNETLLSESAPGEKWAGSALTPDAKSRNILYRLSDENQARLFSMVSPTSNDVTFEGFYPINELFVTESEDENANTVIEFKNKSGQVVLKRVEAPNAQWADTYYVFDDAGNLRTVLTPEATNRLGNVTATSTISADILSNWCFLYKYDIRKRLVEKKVPGAASVYMVYDNLDRLVMTQDGVQRTNNKWSFTKYDVLNRPIISGIYTHSATVDQAGMSSEISTTLFYETFSASSSNAYTNNVFPFDNIEILTVTYYDNYNFMALWPSGYTYVNDGLTATVNTETYNQATTESTAKGQVTGSLTKLIDNGITGGYTYLRNVSYYDDKHRVIQVSADNIKGGIDRTSTLYDFTNKVLKTKTTQYVLNFKSFVSTKNIVNKLVKTTTADAWTAGASSVEVLPAGVDGWIEFSAASRSQAMMIGFSDVDVDANWATIDYALYLRNVGDLQVREGTITNYLSTAVLYYSGNRFRIERIGANIYYYQNGTLLLSRPVSTGALIIDISLYEASAKLVNLRSSFGASSAKTITRRFDYDHAGRLVNTWHQIGSNPEILLNHLEYNELGQLIDKKLHSTDASASNAKQSVDYRYNIRGWLTSMNNAALMNDNRNDDLGDLFGFELGYTDVLNQTGTPQFNGNIAAMTWSNNLGLGDVKEKGYGYAYDPMNRIAAANYNEKESRWSTDVSNRFAESNYTYDLNGNILSLTRNDKRGSAAPMDVLSYNYGTGSSQSNQLLSVSDMGDDFKGFVDGTNSGNDYTYDANGNLTTDQNKGITAAISYNHLNLPQKITKGGNTVDYVYDAGGRKHAQVTTFLNSVKEADYLGEFHYENNALQFINHEEGRAVIAKEKVVFANDGSNLKGMTTLSTSAVNVTQNGETYIQVTSNGSVNAGLYPVGGQFPVTAGDTYKIRVKGYLTSSAGVYLFAKTNLGSILWENGSWKGGALASSAGTEAWTEETITIPASATYLETGIRWGTSLNGDKFFVNEIEVIKLSTNAAPEYQYYMKDHLGNVRLTFTSAPETETVTTDLEPAKANEDQSEFENYNPNSYPLFDHTDPQADVYNYAQLLTGGNSSQIALTRTLSVMPGDRISASVYAKYWNNPSSTGNEGNLPNFASALVSAFGAAPVPGERTLHNVLQDYGTLIAGGFDHSDQPTAPKAFVNILLFDKDFNFVDAAYDQIDITAEQVGTSVRADHDHLEKELLVTEAGYVIVFLSNENPTQVDVYFDDFEIKHIKSPVIQTEDYYPFGLTFNSYSRENSVENKFKFQGQAHVDDLSLNWDGFKWRNHQPDIGRFFNIDPMASAFYYNSPYAFSENKVTTHVELEGLEAFYIHGTNSGPNMWTDDLTEFIRRELTTNKTIDAKYSWDYKVGFRNRNWLFNDEEDRAKAAKGLMMYVMRKRVEGEKITLIGHSHGGNVAIQAAELLWNNYGISVDIINFNTPAYNGFRDKENPEDNFGINNLTHFWTKQDGVAGGLAGSDKYRAPQPNVRQVMMSEPLSLGWLQSHFMDNVNQKEVKKKKPDADKEASKRSGGAH